MVHWRAKTLVPGAWAELNTRVKRTKTNPLECEVVRMLPAYIGERDPIPDGLIGARIVDFGSVPYRDPDGGLVIDYQRRGESIIRRVVFGFTEIGMWVDAASAAQ